MSFNLLALGDVHFDTPSLFGEDERKRLESLKKDAFSKAVDEAMARNANAFLICGDLYDEGALSFETLIFLRKCFLKLASCGIKVIYAHGKSDPGSASDLIKTTNLIDFSLEAERYELVSEAQLPEAIVHAAGFSNNAGFLIDQFDAKDTKYPTIGMMYINEGFTQQGSFIVDSLTNLNYDLFIIGGYHHYLIANAEGNVIYPGSPTGTWFKDKPGGALFAQFNDHGQMTLDKISLSDVSWYDIDVQNITETDIGTLKRKLEVEIQSQVTSTKNAFARITLSGRCYISESLDDEALNQMKQELSKTTDVAVHIEKKNLLPMLPKTLFDNTSPFVESVKIIDAIKNDDEKFAQLVDLVQKKRELFYATVPEEMKRQYGSDFKSGLLDAICKVMIKEASYEN